MSDLPEEEQWAHYERMRQTLERADATLADTDAWLAHRRADGSDIEERYAARQHEERQRVATPQPDPVPAAPRAPARDWPAEQKWVEGIAGRHIEPLAKEIGTVCGMLERRLAELEARAAGNEAAVTELLLELERRIAALETPAAPAGLRLITARSADDAA